MSMLVSQLLTDEIFRRPLTRDSNPETLAAHEAELKARLIDTIQTISLTRFLKEHAPLCPMDGVHIEGDTDQAQGA